MKIGIVDADLVWKRKQRFPNLACMKISSYYKARGHDVKLLLSYDNIEDYDKIFISKVFTDTKVPDEILNNAKVEYGGTGFFYDNAKPLPYEIEHCKPDYNLYDEFVKIRLEKGDNPKTLEYYTNYSIGFATRGCIRRCSFCVNKNYIKCLRSSPISEFVDKNRRYICLLDDNVLACEDWKEVFEELKETGKRFQFKQGIDERLLTDEKCKTIFGSRWIGDFIFAFDNIKDKKIIEQKLKMIRKYTRRRIKFYCFCGYNHDSPDNIESYTNDFWANDIKDLFERIKILISYQALPYIMRYKDYQLSPYRGLYISIASWCNMPRCVTTLSFREFCYKKDGSTRRYLEQFEKDYPNIAKEYFDIKWSDFK